MLEWWLDYLLLEIAYEVFAKVDVDWLFWKECSEQRKKVARAFLRKVISLHLNPSSCLGATKIVKKS